MTVTPESMAEVEIGVSWAKVKPATPNAFPEVQEGGFKHLVHATSRRAGGV